MPIHEPEITEEILEKEEPELKACDLCGCMFDPNEEGHYDWWNNTSLCGGCYSRAVSCDNCSDWIYREDAVETAEGDLICNHCREYSYFECDHCGGIHHNDDLIAHHGNYYCYDCDEELRGGIHEYHDYNITSRFYGNPDNDLFFGIELEVDGDVYNISRDASNVVDIMSNHVLCSEDSSLDNGFEIITFPHSYEEMRKLPWCDLCSYLDSHGYDNWNGRAGMHIHLSKQFFDFDFEAITRFAFFFERFKNFCMEFSRRESGDFNQWCQFCTDAIRPCTSKETVKDHISRYNCHSQLINIGNHSTVECRMFNSTNDPDLILANLELIKCIAYKAKEWTDAQAESASFSDWLCEASSNLKYYINEVYPYYMEGAVA